MSVLHSFFWYELHKAAHDLPWLFLPNVNLFHIQGFGIGMFLHGHNLSYSDVQNAGAEFRVILPVFFRRFLLVLLFLLGG